MTKDELQKRISIDTTSGCWNWTWGKCQGYGATGEGYAHRLSYTMYIGPIPIGLNVLHKCNNRSCVNPEHLYTGTQKDNGRDVIVDNNVGGQKLTIKEVLEIRNSKELSQAQLADKYGVSPLNIRKILKRETWKHI